MMLAEGIPAIIPMNINIVDVGTWLNLTFGLLTWAKTVVDTSHLRLDVDEGSRGPPQKGISKHNGPDTHTIPLAVLAAGSPRC